LGAEENRKTTLARVSCRAEIPMNILIRVPL
jgi:hypothetical protein